MTSLEQQPVLETQNLSKKFGDRLALDALSLKISSGEIFGLLGPNGGGKTTLFRILSTLLAPTGGTAHIFGVDVALRPAEVRRSIGIVFQSPSLDRKLTVWENLIHQGHLYGLRGAVLRDRAVQMLTSLNMIDRKKEMVEKLSGGLQRRVEIAKSLLHEPRLLLMDEPSTGLDPAARLDVWRAVRDLRERLNVTVLLTTHIMEEAEGCDRVAILDQGKLVTIGAPRELKEAISADIISIESQDASALAERILSRFQVQSSVLNGSVRLEHKEGHRFLPGLFEAFPGTISAVTVRKPTLEDVFIRQTGRRFSELT